MAGTVTNILNSAISNNIALDSGGGVRTNAGSITNIINSTVADNSASIGVGVWNFGTVNVKNTIIEGNTGGSAINDIANNLINTNPMIGPLKNNGTLTFTHALLAGNPAIDASDNSSDPATDQHGADRIADGDADTVATVDIGAFEMIPGDLICGWHCRCDRYQSVARCRH